MTTRTGRVVKSIGGYHMVVFSDGQEILLQARGNLKRNNSILVGDRVHVRLDDSGGVIERAMERSNQLARPPIANVDLVLVVFATQQPSPVLDLLDRILAQVEQAGLDGVVVFNKSELIDEVEAESLSQPYRLAGYPVLFTSTITKDGVDRLKGEVGSRIAVMAGPSGVGKTSLLNLLIEDGSLKTQAVSERTQRGRHTTRAVELLPLKKGGWIADTPGFSTLNLGIVDPRSIPTWYPEFSSLGGECRFNGCLHRSEPGCAVQKAVDAGRIDPGRYERYINLLSEIEHAFERRYE